jgi:hypothetical protein
MSPENALPGKWDDCIPKAGQTHHRLGITKRVVAQGLLTIRLDKKELVLIVLA